MTAKFGSSRAAPAAWVFSLPTRCFPRATNWRQRRGRDASGQLDGRIWRPDPAIQLNVTDPDAVRGAVGLAVEQFGRLDVLVNNAGYADLASIEDITDDALHEQIDVNFFGVCNVTRAALPFMRRQRAGHIIQISSVGGRVGGPGRSLSGSQMGGGRILRSACEGGPRFRHPGHDRRAGIDADPLGRFVDDHSAGQRRVQTDHRTGSGTLASHRRHATRRSRADCPGAARHCRIADSAVAIADGQRRGRGSRRGGKVPCGRGRTMARIERIGFVSAGAARMKPAAGDRR